MQIKAVIVRTPAKAGGRGNPVFYFLDRYAPLRGLAMTIEYLHSIVLDMSAL